MDDTKLEEKLEEMYKMIKELYNHSCQGPQAKRSEAEKHQIAMDVLGRALKRQEKRRKAA